jgi:hypothetical protein
MHAFRSPTSHRYGTVHPPLFGAECYLTSSACLALREQYDDGLRKGLLKPCREFCTDIALSQVTKNLPLLQLHLNVAEQLQSHFELPPLRIQYYAYTRIYPGGAHRLHADAVTLNGSPNHTPYRVATAMLYLSDGEVDFAGGSLRFPKLGMEIIPRVGLLVGFLTSLGHQHEVPLVTAGVRDALAMWFQLASLDQPINAPKGTPASPR